jgi:hypothetical protein
MYSIIISPAQNTVQRSLQRSLYSIQYSRNVHVRFSNTEYCIYPGASPSITFCQSIYIFLFVFYIAVSVCCEIQSVKCFSFSCGMLFRKYSFSCTLFNTASYYALRFHCVGGCWDRTQDCCDLGMTDRPLNTRLDLILI